jgi:hypothetical protein
MLAPRRPAISVEDPLAWATPGGLEPVDAGSQLRRAVITCVGERRSGLTSFLTVRGLYDLQPARFADPLPGTEHRGQRGREDHPSSRTGAWQLHHLTREVFAITQRTSRK